MLAKAVPILRKVFVDFVHEGFALFDELFANSLSLVVGERKIDVVHDLIYDLVREPPKYMVHLATSRPMLRLLRWNVFRRWNLDAWVNQK